MIKNKITICLILMLLICNVMLIFNKPSKVLALADIDQTCQYGVTPPQYTYLSHNPIQVFVPLKGGIDAVGLYLGPQIGTSVPVKVEIVGENQGGVISSATLTIPDAPAWVTFDLPNAYTPLGMYGIEVTDADPNKKAAWYHGPTDCCDRGFAIYDNTAHPEFDYRFATYGYDVNGQSASDSEEQADQPVDTSSDTSSGSTSLGTTSGNGQAPTSTTSSSIVAPSNLVAEDLLGDSGGTNKLNWDASITAGIDGYKIFRSESAGSGFTEIGRTSPGFATYLDTKAETGQTFYYFIRAYKGSSESASSNIAEASSFDDIKGILDDFKANNSGGGVLGGVLFTLARIAIPLIIFGFIFILVIVGVVLLIMRSRRNKATAQATTQNDSQKPSDKGSPDSK